LAHIDEIPNQVLEYRGRAIPLKSLLFCSAVNRTGAKSLTANVLSNFVPEIVAVFDEDRGSSGCLRRSPAKAVKAVAFNLDPRNAEVYILAGGYLVEVEPRKIDSEFIDQSGEKMWMKETA